MTRRGIFYKLEESPYTLNYEGYIFYFSSTLYHHNFRKRIDKYIKEVNEKVSKRWKFPVDFRVLAGLYCYINIETRGFLIYDPIMEVYFTCPEQIRLDGESLTKQT